MDARLTQSLIYTNSADPYFQKDFKQVLDSHLEYLKTFPGGQDLPVEQRNQGNFTGDFYAILNDLRIPAKYHRIILRLNGYSNPIQYNGDRLTIFVPNLTQVDSILTVYDTAKNQLRVNVQGS